MVASQNATMVDPTWFTDGGATNHVTSDFANLKFHSEYHDKNTIGVGNGNSLSISHISSSIIHYSPNTFYLNKILHCSNTFC